MHFLLRFFVPAGLWLASLLVLSARDFTVLTYNVENLFDVDGQAEFPEYQQQSNEKNQLAYSPGRLLNKLQNITAILKRIDAGKGPDVIVFEEFERDRTPHSTVADYQAFLEQWRLKTVREMLTTAYTPEVAGLPVEALLLKNLEDHGLHGYRIARPPHSPEDINKPPHINVIFSRFPIKSQRQHPILDARDILEVELDIDGAALVIFNNHWKSGASNPHMETIRVQNASTLRARLDELLAVNPRLPILLAGDFNSDYNQDKLMPKADKTALVGVLGAGSDERALLDPTAKRLYNLWFELPNDRRGSDAYRGHWGTLMHLIVTSGLYDGQGVDYVDNSFFVAAYPGLNAQERWGTPRSWSHFANGVGFSDHFPIGARFRVLPPDSKPPAATSLGGPQSSPDEDRRIGYEKIDPAAMPSSSEIRGMDDETLARHFGDLFLVEARLETAKQKQIRIGKRTFDIYAYSPDVQQLTKRWKSRQPVRFCAELGEYRGRLQWTIHLPTWILTPSPESETGAK